MEWRNQDEKIPKDDRLINLLTYGSKNLQEGIFAVLEAGNFDSNRFLRNIHNDSATSAHILKNMKSVIDENKANLDLGPKIKEDFQDGQTQPGLHIDYAGIPEDDPRNPGFDFSGCMGSSTATVVPSTEKGSDGGQTGTVKEETGDQPALLGPSTETVATPTETVASSTPQMTAKDLFEAIDTKDNTKPGDNSLSKTELKTYIQEHPNVRKLFGLAPSGETGGPGWQEFYAQIDKPTIDPETGEEKEGDGKFDLDEFTDFYNKRIAKVAETPSAGKRKTSLKRNAQKKSLRRNKQIHNKIRKTRKNRNQKKSISKRR